MSTNFVYFQSALCNNFSGIMVFNINVLCSLMKYLIFCEIYSILTVIKQINARCVVRQFSIQIF
jgi:hypothetical protein